MHPQPNTPNGLKIQPDMFLLCLILPDINGLRGHQTAQVGNMKGWLQFPYMRNCRPNRTAAEQWGSYGAA